MSVARWRATCIQMKSGLAAQASGREMAWKVIHANILHAVEMIEVACTGSNPPCLVVLPEFGMQGPPLGETVAEWIDKACSPVPGRITEPLQHLAKRLGIYIAGNQFEAPPEWPGRYFNSCFLIDPRGEILLRYRRINTAVWPSPHDFMEAYLARHGIEGTFPVVDTELGRLGMIACGELAVPEVARMLMLRGAEVILHPTNEGYSPGQEAAKIARAAENMVYVVSANVAGPIGFSPDGSQLGGRSRIIDFRGGTLAHDERTEESTSVSAQIDIEKLRAARSDIGLKNTILRSRFEMYRTLYADTVFYPANQFLTEPMSESAAALPIARTTLAKMRRMGIVTMPTDHNVQEEGVHHDHS